VLAACFESGIIALMRRNRATVALIVYDGLALFEFGVACDVFGLDRTDEFGVPWYRMSVCAADPGSVMTDAGIELKVTEGLRSLRNAETILVPPTDQLGLVAPVVLSELRRAHHRGARIVSLCSGALVLAASGLLDGRPATTHWEECAELSRRHPTVRVDPNVLYVDDGDILTSAGSAASIDLCLYIVRQDYGADIAGRLARDLVVPPFREGGQAQYIQRPVVHEEGGEPFAEVMAWMVEHLDATVSIEGLAKRCAMSKRNFSRRFLAVTGTTPYRWLNRQRLHRAQELLETTDQSIEIIATSCGFTTATSLREHFAAEINTSPAAYRKSFHQKAG
jgi:AraC family transcriptional regulator, transcriptional activator FtrA